MKIVAVVALACGVVAAPMASAGDASASPECEGLDCAPYVTLDVAAGEPCTERTRYVFGYDSSGGTLVCTGEGKWEQAVPLQGVRTSNAPCEGKGTAQTPDGSPLTCDGQAFRLDFAPIFMPETARAEGNLLGTT